MAPCHRCELLMFTCPFSCFVSVLNKACTEPLRDVSHMGSGDSVLMSATGRALNLSHRHLRVLADAFKDNRFEVATDVVELDVSCNFISAIDSLELIPFLAIRRLILSANELTEVPALDALPFLEQLYLNNNKITRLSPQLASLSGLRLLDLRSNRIEDARGLSGCMTQLERYVAAYAALITLLSKWCSLRMSLSCNRLTDQGLPLHCHFPSLKSLGLFGNRIDQLTSVVSFLEQHAPHLEEVVLGGNPMRRGGELPRHVQLDACFRRFLIERLPRLRVIDWRYVTLLESQACHVLA